MRRTGIALSLVLGACSVYDESLLVDAKPGFDPKSCRWGDCWWSEARDGCRSADQPSSEERPVDAPGENVEIIVALSKLWLGESLPPGAADGIEPWQAVGLDLDGVCTNPADCSAAVADVVSCTNANGIVADGAGCRDNALARIFPAAAATVLGTTYGISEDKLNCGLHRGSYTLLIRIRDYAGGANDNNVRVDVYPSPGVEESLPYECDVANWQGQLPVDSNFAWSVDQAALQPGTGDPLPESVLADPAAYVKNGYLVARFADGSDFTLPGTGSQYSGLSLAVFGPMLVARIEQNVDTTWALRDGLLAGRLRRDELVTSLRQTGFCDTTAGAEYDQVVVAIDGALDVLANGGSAASASCDALSFGIGFEANQAKPGQPVAVAPPGECVGN